MGSEEIRSRLDRATNLHGAGDLKTAERLYREVLEVEPDNAQARHLLGVLALQRGRPDDAVERIRAAIEIGPAEAAWHYNLGNALQRLGRPGEAVASYREAVGLAPEWPAAWNNLGVALQHQGRFDEAADAFERAWRIDPDSQDALANLGTVRQRQGRFEEAIACLRGAVEIAPQRSDLHYNLANALSAAGRWPEAEAGYRQAIELEPDNAPAHYNLGVMHHHQGRLDEAAAAYQRATELDDGYLEALTNLGVVLRERGRVDQATDCFRAACALRPDDPVLERNLRSALNQQLPAWHWPMLADESRNQAYRQAIERAVDGTSVVLDIGTGSGLLAMMAARAGAKRVVACEISPVLAEVAREVVRSNGLADRVAVINRKSTALRVGEDLEEPANLLVSEIVDVGLLGEGVLPSMRHALEHLAVPGARVIPRGATVYARLVEMPDQRRVNPVRRISGFDLSAFDRFRIPGDYLDMRLARTSHRFLSDPVEVTRFDFAAPLPYVPDRAPTRIDIALQTCAAGSVHAVAFWFDLRLDDAIAVSSAPDGGLIAWGQAVQFLDTDLEVANGERLRLQASVSDTRIGFEVLPGVDEE